ncbi:MAG: endopolygalacturonase [Candidatus Hydrogenedentes bacterium]|nr:endopolygalacturonase [Candidatus Hydrogenedentota bacterium]
MGTLSFSMEPYGVSVRDAGARGDGTCDDGPAIQKALDGLRPVVTIPAGLYLVGTTLRIGSGKTLLAHPDAVIRLADGAGRTASDFLLANADYESGNSQVRVCGGVWDGNNENNARGPDGSRESYTGVALNFVHVSHLQLAGLTIRNPDSFSVRLGEIRHFTVDNIVFDHPVLRPNQDGVHVGGYCEDGTIRNLRALTPDSTNDDMVALNADDDVERAINLGMKRGPIRDIHVEGLAAESAYTFVRILSETQPVRNIRICDVSGGCRTHAINVNRWRFPAGCGNIANVRISGVRVGKTADARTTPLVSINLQARDLTIEQLERPDDGCEAPTLVVDTGAENEAGLIVRSREQLQRLEADSAGLEGSVRPLTMPDGAILYQATMRTTAAGRILLAAGGIEHLALNSGGGEGE